MNNCSNCGAPMAYPGTYCTYCGTGGVNEIKTPLPGARTSGPGTTPDPLYTYTKVGIARRIFGVMIDIILSLGIFIPWLERVNPNFNEGPLRDPWPIIFFLGYGLLKDCLFRGRSVGKLLAGTMVINADKNTPCNVFETVMRNGISFLMMLAPFGFVIDLIIIARDPKGCKPGDRVAHTQVILTADYRTQ